MPIKYSRIDETNAEGLPSGDNCEKCETTAKPIYHLESDAFCLDIMLCPKCVAELTSDLVSIAADINPAVSRKAAQNPTARN